MNAPLALHHNYVTDLNTFHAITCLSLDVRVLCSFIEGAEVKVDKDVSADDIPVKDVTAEDVPVHVYTGVSWGSLWPLVGPLSSFIPAIATLVQKLFQIIS